MASGSEAPKRLVGGADNFLGHHPHPVVLLVGLLLKEHVVDEEGSTNEGRLAPHVKIHWEPFKVRIN